MRIVRHVFCHQYLPVLYLLFLIAPIVGAAPVCAEPLAKIPEEGSGNAELPAGLDLQEIIGKVECHRNRQESWPQSLENGDALTGVDEEFYIGLNPIYGPSQGDETEPAVAFDGTNHLVVWGDSRSGIYGTRVSTSGDVLDPGGIEVCHTRDCANPAVIYDGTNYLVVWDQPELPGGYDRDIRGARVSPSGAVLDSAAIGISDASGHQREPAAAFDGTDCMVIWCDGRTDYSGDIYGARVSLSGVVLDPGGFIVHTGARGQVSPAIASDGTGYLAVWNDGSNYTSWAVYATFITMSGEVPDTAGFALPSGPGHAGTASLCFGASDYLVAWEDSAGVRGARVAPEGTVRDPGGLAISSAPEAQSPQVAFDGEKYLVVWSDERNGRNPDIYGARVTTSGAVLDTLGIGVAAEYDSQTGPTVAFDGTNYFVFWSDGRLESSNDIRGARVAPTGAKVGSGDFKISISTSRQRDPVAAFDGTNYLVVWEDLRWSVYDGYDIYGTRVSQSGEVLDPDGIAICTADFDQTDAAVAFDGVNFVVVWEDTRDLTDQDLYGARVSRSGQVLDPNGKAICGAPGKQSSPKIAAGGGNSLVVWHDYRPAPTPPICAMRYNTSLQSLDSNYLPLPSAGASRFNPSVMFGGQDYLVLWGERDDDTGYDIWGARVTVSGQVLDPGGIPICTAVGSQYGTCGMASDGTSYLVVWPDERSGDPEIYGARISKSGAVLDPAGIRVQAAAEGLDYGSPTLVFDGKTYAAVFYVWHHTYSIMGKRVDRTGIVLDPEAFVIFESPLGISAPAVGRGPGSQILVTYSRFRPAPFGSDRIWGIFWDCQLDTDPPENVTNFEAIAREGALMLRWRNPSDQDFYGTVIRFSTADYPSQPDDGIPLPNRPSGLFLNQASSRDSCLFAGLAYGTDYYFTAFASDSVSNYASGVSSMGTPLPDHTPPTLSISVFQNPYITNHLDIYLIGSEPLSEVRMVVKTATDSVALALTESDTVKNVWRGDYDICCKGQLTIAACAKDLALNPKCVTHTFTSTLLLAQSGGLVASVDGQMTLSVPGGALLGDTYVLVSESIMPGSGERGIYEISPATLSLAQPAQLSLSYADTTAQPEHLCVAKWVGGGPTVVESYLDRREQRIIAPIRQFGSYGLVWRSDQVTPPLDEGGLRVLHNVPNPFAASTTIVFEAPRTGVLNLEIVAVDGRIVRRLTARVAIPGRNSINWDGCDHNGRKVASGVYMCRIRFDGQDATHKMVQLD